MKLLILLAIIVWYAHAKESKCDELATKVKTSCLLLSGPAQEKCLELLNLSCDDLCVKFESKSKEICEKAPFFLKSKCQGYVDEIVGKYCIRTLELSKTCQKVSYAARRGCQLVENEEKCIQQAEEICVQASNSLQNACRLYKQVCAQNASGLKLVACLAPGNIVCKWLNN
jgi:hypothetical protein